MTPCNSGNSLTIIVDKSAFANRAAFTAPLTLSKPINSHIVGTNFCNLSLLSPKDPNLSKKFIFDKAGTLSSNFDFKS